MAAQSSNAANATVVLSQKLNKMIAGGLQDYHSWRSLILEIETASLEDIDIISLAYESFLSVFPLCHWHLEKYAYHKAKLCGTQEAVKIYEQGVEVGMFSVGFWVDYFTFGACCFGDPEDVRRLFGKAVSFVGKDYYCHVLWDKYMKYEFNQDGWGFLAHSYIQALRFPTKKLHFYYENFKQFVANLKEEMEYEKNKSMELDEVSVPCAAAEISMDKISLVIKDLLDSSDRSLKSKALDRYRSIGEEFYEEARQVDEKIKCFETKIRRRYFHVTPLDDDEISNWHLYLDFIEKQDNLDSAVKLYERCLIPCANYPEFWMRYVEFVESKGGRELAVSALDRATKIFLKNVPEIHLLSARFKEHIGDVDGARAALLLCDTKNDSSFIENISALANLERRLGNFAVASATYEKAIKTAREKRRLHVLPRLYSHFAGLTFLITGGAAAARDILIEGIRQVPRCRFLLEELIRFAMTHEGASQVNIVDLVIADAISSGEHEYEGLNAKDREDISCLFLEFVNLCGTVHDIRNAWNRHIKLFPRSLRNQTTYESTSANQRFGHGIQLQGQEQVLKFPANHEIHPNQVLGRPSPSKDNNVSAKEPERALSCKDVLSNEDAHWDSSYQSREDKPEPMVVGAELADQSKENTLSTHESSLDLSSRGDKPGHMELTAALAKQSKENALNPHESVHEVGKSSEATESIDMSRSSLIYVQPASVHVLKQQKHPVSLNSVSPNSDEKESQESIPMSCDEHETKKSVPTSREPTPAPNSIQIGECRQVYHDSEQDGSVTRQHNTPTRIHADPEELTSTAEDSIEADHVVPAPQRATSSSQEHTHCPANILDSKVPMNLDSAEQGPKRSQAQLGAVQEDKAGDQDRPASMLTPPNTMSAGQAPASSQPVSYPQQNMNQMTSPSSQYPWQTQQNLAINQMLQYHYHQQQILQQQYQQQLQMQQTYMQYMSQQPYQLHPQPQNQQQMQIMQQQHYVQQQQLQSQSYQLPQQMPTFQQSPQLQQQNPQLQQGQDSQQNFQQSHEKQYHQSQDLPYQLAYQQHVSQAQQLLLQQYHGYQNMLNQQQSQEGPHQMQGQQTQKQLNELPQQYHQQLISNQNFTQNQQGSKSAPPDSRDAAEPCESPRRQVKSLDVLL